MIASSVGSSTSFSVYKRLEPGRKYHVLVHQFQRCNGKDYFQVKFNNWSKELVENTNAQEFSDVKVYASNPWYNTFDGKLENLVYTNQGTFYFLEYLVCIMFLLYILLLAICRSCGSPATCISNGERFFLNCNPSSPIAE